VVWVLVELLRDRKDGRERASAREAAKRLEKHLAADFKGGRVVPFETIRRYHKKIEKLRQKNAEQAALGDHYLRRGRVRRDTLGWDASPWLFVFDPQDFEDKGITVQIK
jgi:hypothetical protein